MFNEMSIALAPPSNSCSLASCRNILLAVVSCLIFSPEIPSVHSPSPPRWWSICSCKLKKQRGKRSEIVWVGSPQALSLVSTVSCPDQHAVPTTTMEREDRRYKGSHGSQTDNKLPRLKCIYSSNENRWMNTSGSLWIGKYLAVQTVIGRRTTNSWCRFPQCLSASSFLLHN